MPCFTQQVVSNRILINVLISAFGHKVVLGSGNSAGALVDTGATGSCVSKKIANKLGILPIGKTQMTTASGIVESNVYCVNLHIPVLDGNTTAIRSFIKLQLLESHMPDGCEVIIGMDVIRSGSLHISDGHFTFCI